MIRMSTANIVSAQNGYAGRNRSCPIAFRPATPMPNHVAASLPLTIPNAARSWRTPRTSMIQPHVFRSLKTNLCSPTYTLESAIARMPWIVFHDPARPSIEAAKRIQPPPRMPSYPEASTRVYPCEAMRSLSFPGSDLDLGHVVDRADFAHFSSPLVSGKRLGLDGVELRLANRAAVEEGLGPLDLRGGPTFGCHRTDVLVHVLPGRRRLFDVPARHVVRVRDQIHEDAQEWNEEDEQKPNRLLCAARIAAAEHVPDDVEQQDEPRHPQKEDEHAPQRVDERVVGKNHWESLPGSRTELVVASRSPVRTPVIMRNG